MQLIVWTSDVCSSDLPQPNTQHSAQCAALIPKHSTHPNLQLEPNAQHSSQCAALNPMHSTHPNVQHSTQCTELIRVWCTKRMEITDLNVPK